ncbi:sugar kinase [Desulfonema magnum]|uniref:Robosomal protein domain-containing protein n=1 Tax=Desulfonema magnum TaxID=45655 RepID=A0A975BFQ5_9BACT|nr:sugar kinase [Desulfonema magnum]QTA84587.1 robosomal protein domain-containing protein [Desulfonema magnum]
MEKQKIEIGIIGGRFDKVSTVLEEFEPGNKRFIHSYEKIGIKPRKVDSVSEEREVKVKVPARLHPTVLDMNCFNLDRPGGGGIGVSIGVYFHANVKAIKEPEIRTKGERSLIVRHFCHIFKTLLGYTGGFEIELYDHKRRHVGLGSSIGSMCAVCIGMNEVLGRPFYGWELRRIMGYHSCEESPMSEGHLLPAFETGIGAMVGVNGGWVVAGDDLVMIHRVDLPDTKVIVFIPEVKSLEDEFTGKETSAESEVELLLRRARTLDAMQAGAKSRIILFDMLPAMVRGDLQKIGDALFDICYLGSKRAECEQHGAYGTPIYSYINALRGIGVEIAGMSSVGPTIFALTQKQDVYDRAMAYLKSLGVSETRIIETEVDNMGGTVTENGVERSFINDNWLKG